METFYSNGSWAKIIDQNDAVFRGKIEGLTAESDRPDRVNLVIDDDTGRPSNLYEVELLGPWLRSTSESK